MIYLGNDNLKYEEGEPVLRSCWECNSAHEHLKKVNTLHCCFSCGRYWIFGRFMDSLEDGAAFDAFFSKELGLKSGQSTTTIDRGYRIVSFQVDIGSEEGAEAVKKIAKELRPEEE